MFLSGASNEMVRIQKKETYVVTSASAAEFSPSKPKEKESSSESAQAGDLQAAFLYTVQLERGLEFERAKLLLQDSLEAWGGSAANVSLNGFYVLKNAHGAQRRSPMLVTRAALTERQRLSNAALFFVDTPNFGRKAKLMNIDELTRKYRKVCTGLELVTLNMCLDSSRKSTLFLFLLLLNYFFVD